MIENNYLQVGNFTRHQSNKQNVSFKKSIKENNHWHECTICIYCEIN